jgi:hypothetical protein
LVARREANWRLAIAIIIVCCLPQLLFWDLIAGAATYFVSPSGSDSNSGSSAAPFKTIQKAANIVNPGDTVIVKDGTYTDTNGDHDIVRITRGGTTGAWITFKAENKWGAVLDGQNNTAGYGFDLVYPAQYIKIQDFEIKGVNGTAIFANPLSSGQEIGFITVYGNKIHDIARHKIGCTGEQSYGHCGVYGSIYTHDWTIDSNVFWHIGRIEGGLVGTSCATTAPWDDYIHDHAIYTGHTGATSQNHTYNWDIVNNVVYEGDSSTHFPGFFVALGKYSENINIINNTVQGRNYVQNGVIYLNPGMININIQNNIFADAPQGFIQNNYSTNPMNLTIYNNLTTAASVHRPFVC